MDNPEFWEALDKLVDESVIIIDRPKGSRHPKYGFVYIADYGYIDNMKSMDGGGIDVWRGSGSERKCDAVICTIDLLKRDSEIKILLGCSEEEKEEILNFYNESKYMKGQILRRYGVED